jgi:hypothetical protein
MILPKRDSNLSVVLTFEQQKMINELIAALRQDSLTLNLQYH